jgi:ligand-binding sensor domain-containing protein
MTRIFVIIFVLLVTISTSAQQYNFISYSVEQGLAQSQIRAISQDKDGYIWIGTLGGLSKFDGIDFENFSTNDGLLNNQINAIYNDSKGSLWLGTQGGVSVYDGSSFKNFQFKDELSQNFVLSIAEDKSGKIWLTTDGGGMVYMDDTRFNYLILPNGPDNNYIRNVFIDNQNNKWCATRNGVSIIDGQLNIKDTIKDVNATQIFVDEKSVWCSTFGDGVLRITKNNHQNYSIRTGLISNHIRAFAKQLDGTVWFVSKNGISKYSNGVIKNFTNKDGLNDNNIKTVIEDSEGNLFFGTDGGGLIKFTNDNFISYTKSDGISSSVVMSIVEDSDLNIWVSTYGGGVCKIKGSTYEKYGEKDALGNNTVWCSLLAKDKRVWFGTSDGVSVFDGVGFNTYKVKDGLNAKKIYALNEDKKGNIWIGTKEGLSVLYTDVDSIYNYKEIAGLSRNLRYIYNEDDVAIWFCSSDGLFRYDIKTHTAEKFDESNGLPNNSVYSIVKDKSNKLWVGTKNGLAIYNQGSFTVVQLPDNYASNNINFLQLDKEDKLWIGTNFGLYQLNILDKDTFAKTDFIRYSNLDGLKSLECNMNASYIDSKNNLWFGTNHGLMKHSLNTRIEKASLPKVQIKGIRLFFEKKDLSKYANGINESNKLPKDLVLKYNKNHLTFDFVGIYHTSPDKVKYRFKLEGFDEIWQPITKSTFVTYSNIPFGDFIFKLSATTDLKNWTKPIRFSFIIKPPFWFTWWFYLLCVLSFVSTFWLVVRRRKKIADNKRDTQLIIDKSKMLKLEQQALNSSMNRHFIFNSLNSIQYYINRQDKISANKYLSSFAKLVRKNLDSSLVNEIYLDEEIERIELYLKLEQMRFQDKFIYNINIDKAIEHQTVKIPSMLLQPFIENSIWHGILPREKRGTISIDAIKKDEKLIINIIDDGIGIDKSLNDKKDKKQYHDSKGMKLTKSRIELIGKISNKECSVEGPKQIYNEKNEIAGTKVSIIISL